MTGSFQQKPFLSPAPGGLPPKASSSVRGMHERQATNAGRETQDASDRVQRFLADYIETPVVTNGETLFVLARRIRTPGEGSSPSASGSLQVRLRRVEKKYNIGITPGVFQGVFGSVVPTIQPSGAAMDVSPVYWWPDDLVPSAENAKKIWAKAIISDRQPYYGIITDVEIHLLDAGRDPDPHFSRSAYQWLHLASISAENGQMFATPHISGSPGVTRQGGPGSAYVFYPV